MRALFAGLGDGGGPGLGDGVREDTQAVGDQGPPACSGISVLAAGAAAATPVSPAPGTRRTSERAADAA
ncbi:hypothetical protein AB0K68_28435 [Streptomyces sp. NPDC050698]